MAVKTTPTREKAVMRSVGAPWRKHRPTPQPDLSLRRPPIAVIPFPRRRHQPLLRARWRSASVGEACHARAKDGLPTIAASNCFDAAGRQAASSPVLGSVLAFLEPRIPRQLYRAPPVVADGVFPTIGVCDDEIFDAVAIAS